MFVLQGNYAHSTAEMFIHMNINTEGPHYRSFTKKHCKE